MSEPVRRRRSYVLAFLSIATIGAGSLLRAQMPAAPASPDEVAIVDGEAISGQQLRDAIGGKSIVPDTMAYQLRRGALEELIGRRLLEKEAVHRGMSVAELEADAIAGRVQPLSDEEAKLIYTTAPQAFAGRSEADAIIAVKEQVRRQRLATERAGFAASLRKKYRVRIMLEPPRATIDVRDALHAKGPADAPVTIVEYSDFQCPYCARMSPVLTRLAGAFPEDVRLVFKHYPLPIHDRAVAAANAAECAAEDGKFWEMKQLLFENQIGLTDSSLTQFAATLKLNLDAFRDCLQSNKYAVRIEKDQADGQRSGVGSTPTLFVNGRLVPGAQPYEAIVALVDEELDRVRSDVSQRR